MVWCGVVVWCGEGAELHIVGRQAKMSRVDDASIADDGRWAAGVAGRPSRIRGRAWRSSAGTAAVWLSAQAPGLAPSTTR